MKNFLSYVSLIKLQLLSSERLMKTKKKIKKKYIPKKILGALVNDQEIA